MAAKAQNKETETLESDKVQKGAQKIIVINRATPWLESVILLFIFLSCFGRTEWYWETLKYFAGTLLIINSITFFITLFSQMKQGEKMPDYLNPDNYKKA